jgi:hypothetical protein
MFIYQRVSFSGTNLLTKLEALRSPTIHEPLHRSGGILCGCGEVAEPGQEQPGRCQPPILKYENHGLIYANSYKI